jgi:hypothetical protein
MAFRQIFYSKIIGVNGKRSNIWAIAHFIPELPELLWISGYRQLS